MKHLLTLAAFLFCFQLQACPYASKLADAIYVAEGGSKTKYPYGVKSIKTRDAAHARQITLNSIRNNWRRWEQSGKPGEFVPFMARRWCPPLADPVGYRNWTNNVTLLMKGKP